MIAKVDSQWVSLLRGRHPFLVTLLDTTVLETIAVLLVILWLLGLVTSYTMGGLIHILLVIAVVAVLLRLISGRRV